MEKIETANKESYGESPFRTRKSSLAMLRDTTNKKMEEYSEKMARHRNLFRLFYTVVVIIAISIIWISLVGPLVIGLLSKPDLTNISTTYVTQLDGLLTANRPLLPQKCPSGNVTNNRTNSTIKCPLSYVFNCTMCVPICGLQHPYGESYYIGYRVTTIAAGIVDLIFSIFGLIILLKVPGTFKFPQINYLFMFINAVIFSLFLTAASLPGPYYFFCVQRDEDYSIVAETPSIHLTIIGFIIHYAYFSFNLWFLCATVNVFIIVYFPSWDILRSKKHKITLFIIESCIGFGVPLLFPVFYLAIYKNYSFIRLPQVPFITEPLPGLVFIILPLLLFTAFSLTTIALTVYKLQLQKLIVMAGRQKIQLKSYETRLIIFAISLGIVVFVVFVEISFDIRYKDILQLFLEEYWACLTIKLNFRPGNVNGTCPMDFLAYSIPILAYIADTGLGIWSILLLVILTTKETRDAWAKLFRRLCGVPLTVASKGRSVVSAAYSKSKINPNSENVKVNQSVITATNEFDLSVK